MTTPKNRDELLDRMDDAIDAAMADRGSCSVDCRAVLAALEASGLAIVPVVPNAEMQVAGAHQTADYGLAERTYRAMLRASPFAKEE